MASLLGILIPACAAAFVLYGHLLGFAARSTRSLVLGLALLALSGLLGKLKLGQTTSLDFGLLLFILLGWAGLWTDAPGVPRLVLAHPQAALFACLSLSGLLSPILGRRPFTAPSLARSLPRQAEQAPGLPALARGLDRLWSALFVACLASTLVPLLWPSLDGPAGWVIFMGVIPPALLLGPGLALHRRRVDQYLRRSLPAPPSQPERNHPPRPKTNWAQDSPCSQQRRNP